MPYIVKKDLDACPISKPWAVANATTGDVRGRCHPTKARARQQQKALYASMRKEAMKLGEGEYFLVPVENLFAEDDAPTSTDTTRWVQAFPYDTWDHPIYGKTTVTPDVAKQYVKNFKDNVRGQDLAINYDHGEDKSKGNRAAGWIKDMEARANGLFLKVDFTPTAVEELKNGEWRYFSSESFDTWTHPHTGEKYQFVVTGGALTNKPWVKNMLPINFSEVLTEEELEEVEKEFAIWSDSYVNDLPDSAFLFIEDGGKKDSEGKTNPYSLRHLPYKDKDGKVDLGHLRNAIARIPQMVGLSESKKNSLQARAKNMLGGMSKAAEIAESNPEFAKAFVLLQEAGLAVFDESKEWEHSEPGVGSPPPPRTDGDGHDEKDRTEGWRRPDLPSGFPKLDPVLDKDKGFAESHAITALKSAITQVTAFAESTDTDEQDKIKAQMWLADAQALVDKSIGEVGYADVRNQIYCMPYIPRKNMAMDYSEKSKGGTKHMAELTEKDVQKLMHFFDVDDEGKLVEAVQLKFGELQELQRAAAVADQESKFAEEYPDMWNEHKKLMAETRETDAKIFSEGVKLIRRQDGYALKETRRELNSKALGEVSEVHKKFADGSGTLEDFERVIKTIVNGGIVELGERGASNAEGENVPEFDGTTASGIAGARQMFAELTQKEIDSHAAEWGELSYSEKLFKAGDEVANKHPDLAEAYRRTVSA